MVYPILATVGCLLLIIGLMNLGKIPPTKSVAAILMIVGVIVCGAALFLTFADALSAFGPTASFACGVSCFMFGMLYLLCGMEIYHGGDFKVAGWYSLIAGLYCFFVGLGWLNVMGTALPPVAQFGIWNIIWAVAFWLVFIVYGLGVAKLAKTLGWWLIIPVVAYTLFYPVIAFTNFNIIG